MLYTKEYLADKEFWVDLLMQVQSGKRSCRNMAVIIMEAVQESANQARAEVDTPELPQMSMADAVHIARETLAEHHKLFLIDGKMCGHHKAAAAYNRLAEYDLMMMGSV